ncbi:MAG: type IV toxin-antitoxin system AbiEi family antitoxin domain-containing protein [Actinomycetota bacterium]
MTDAGHWIISRAEALASGLSRYSIRRRVVAGAWLELHPGVYSTTGMAPNGHGALLAACKWAGPESFASHRSAGEVWELEGVESGLVEISCYTARRRPGIVVHRLRRCDRPPTRVLKGIRVTLVERTLLDLAGVLPIRAVGLALDDALRRRLTNLDRLWKVWETDGGKGRKGTKNLRRLLAIRDRRDNVLATRFEKKMRRILRRILPEKLIEQCRVTDGGRNFYIDFAYPHALLGIECHSIKWHMGEEPLKKDLRRDRRLKLMGWTILYYSWDDVVFTPDKVEAEIRELLSKSGYFWR